MLCQLRGLPVLVLRDVRFPALSNGQRPTDSHNAVFGSDTAPLVALLDAAAHHQVPEMLQADAPEALCLWQGTALATMAEHAPWLAPLTPCSVLWRNLLTAGEAPWQMWGRWPGLLIRPRRDLHRLRTHLRKLNRVSDAGGTSYFLRYWEPATAEAFWAAFPDDPDHLWWRYGEDVAAVAWPVASGLRVAELQVALPRGKPLKHPIDAYRPLFRQVRWDRFTERLHAALGKAGSPFDAVGRDHSRHLCDTARDAGYTSEAAIWDVVRAMILFAAAGRDKQTEAARAWSGARPPDPDSAAQLLLAQARKIPAETGAG